MAYGDNKSFSSEPFGYVNALKCATFYRLTVLLAYCRLIQ